MNRFCNQDSEPARALPWSLRFPVRSKDFQFDFLHDQSIRRRENAMFRFLPKEFNFFDLFDRQVGYAVDAAVFFKELVSKNGVNDLVVQRMRDIEHQGDEVAHEIIDRLNKTFITPIDREDIHKLTVQIDDIIDMIYTIVNRLRIYKIHETDKSLVEFAAMIEKSVRAVASAVKALRNLKNVDVIHGACVEVNRLENEGDTLRDIVLVEIFEKAKDPIAVIKWKEIYQDAETLLDICEDVAHIVESIVVKQA